MKIDKSKLPILGALAADIGIAIVKFIASAITGSASMFSEGIHSFIECGNQVLLLIGMKRSKKPADQMHNFGYGMEVYFWTLIVSMLLFATGGGVSIYQGIMHIIKKDPLENPLWNYIVLAFALVFDGLSLLIRI